MVLSMELGESLVFREWMRDGSDDGRDWDVEMVEMDGGGWDACLGHVDWGRGIRCRNCRWCWKRVSCSLRRGV